MKTTMPLPICNLFYLSGDLSLVNYEHHSPGCILWMSEENWWDLSIVSRLGLRKPGRRQSLSRQYNDRAVT
jgi:hypothetical protein